ncbi:MAG: DUF4386 domain-containing protein [Gemmatimonadales bacterium]
MPLPGEYGPRAKARLTGAFYLVTIVLGAIGEVIAGRIVVPSDAVTTAANAVQHAGLVELGFACFVIEMVAQTVTTILFYELLRPVSRTISLAAAAVSLVGIAVKTTARVFFVAPLFVLGAGPHGLFQGDPLPLVALLLFRTSAIGAGVALALFGFYAIAKGWLIFRSMFLPAWLGVLGIVAGIGWLAFLAPLFGNRIFAVVAAVGVIGALAQIAWLLTVGLDETRWREMAERARGSEWG